MYDGEYVSAQGGAVPAIEQATSVEGEAAAWVGDVDTVSNAFGGMGIDPDLEMDVDVMEGFFNSINPRDS